jgi:hypothetical protein
MLVYTGPRSWRTDRPVDPACASLHKRGTRCVRENQCRSRRAGGRRSRKSPNPGREPCAASLREAAGAFAWLQCATCGRPVIDRRRVRIARGRVASGRSGHQVRDLFDVVFERDGQLLACVDGCPVRIGVANGSLSFEGFAKSIRIGIDTLVQVYLAYSVALVSQYLRR